MIFSPSTEVWSFQIAGYNYYGGNGYWPHEIEYQYTLKECLIGQRVSKFRLGSVGGGFSEISQEAFGAVASLGSVAQYLRLMHNVPVGQLPCFSANSCLYGEGMHSFTENFSGASA